LKICLAASGGGHVRQLLDLEPVWGEHDAFFLTEDTALGRSLSDKRRTRFVPHVALGQGRLGKPLQMLGAAVSNFVACARAVLKERPDVVLTTGAGAVFFGVLWARLLGAKVVVIESFARFDAPSVFWKIASPLAHAKVVQSGALAAAAPDAAVFDPLRVLDAPRPAKAPLVFATVGATLPFDRLSRSVADAKARGLLPERLVLQTGEGGFRPETGGVEVHETLPFDRVRELLRTADLVICHGGTGSLITALREGCRVVALPRRFDLGEHYDDHQSEITEAFQARGLIVSVGPDEDFGSALARARAMEPKSATTDPAALIAHLKALIARWRGEPASVAIEPAPLRQDA
jgi:UDP-N-acetylglucosamine transferase subunit ALG13